MSVQKMRHCPLLPQVTAVESLTRTMTCKGSGMRLRLGLSVGGVAPLLGGRMLWLIGLGVAQALVLFAVAAVVYRVPLIASLLPWLVTAICAAAASGGIALLLAAACQTREQAQTISTFVILILAAGGDRWPRAS